MRGRSVHFVTEFDQSGSRRVEPFRSGESQERRLIRRAVKVKLGGQDLILFLRRLGRWGCVFQDLC